MEELARLFESRLPVYRELGETVSSEGRAPAQVAEEILEKLRARGRGGLNRSGG